MKKNLLLMAAFSLSCLTIQAQSWDEPMEPTTGSEVISGHKYQVRVVDEYLQNMELDYRLAGGSSWYTWSTSTVLVDKSAGVEPLTFTLNETDNGWTFNRTTDGKFTFISGAHASGWGEMHVDQGDQNVNLHFFGLQKLENGNYRIYAAPANATQCNSAFQMSLSTTEPELFWGWQPYDENGESTGDYEFAVYAAVNPADGFACEWEFIDYSIYDARMELYNALVAAAECDFATIDYSAAEKVYLDENASMDAIEAAASDLKAAVKAAEANAILAGATQDKPADGTSLIENADFGWGNTNGWDLSFVKGTNVTNLGYMGTSYTNNAYTYENHINEEVNPNCINFIEAWANSKFNPTYDWRALGDGSLSQTLRALPAGKYKFTCDAIAVVQDHKEIPATGVQLFAIGGNIDLNHEIATGDGVPEHVELTFISSGGDITLGLRTVNTNANWIAADNFELMYYGEVSENTFQALLSDKINETLNKHNVEDLEEIFAYNETKKNFVDALGTAQNVAGTDGLTDDEYKAAQTAFEAVVAELETSIEAYKSLEKAIATAESRAASLEDGEWAALADIISDEAGEWKDAYEAGTYDNETAASKSDALSEMIGEYISNNCKEGDDVTILLENPGFTGGFAGWLTTGAGVAYADNYDQGENDAPAGIAMAEEGNAPLEGDGLAERWHAAFSMYQIIKNMPRGLYTLSCQGFNRHDDGDMSTAELYAVLPDGSVQTAPFADIDEYGTVEPLYTNNGQWFGDALRGNGLYVPNGMTGAAWHFMNKLDGENYDYQSKIDIVMTEQGDLELGARCDNTHQWVIFDNFRIVYKGNGASVFEEAINDAIAAGNKAIDATRAEDEMGNVKPGISTKCDDDWQTLCNEAVEAVASGDGDLAGSYLQKLRDYYTVTVPASAAALQALADEYVFTTETRVLDLETSYEGLENILDEVYNALYEEGVETDEAATEYIEKIHAEFGTAVMYDAEGSEDEPADVTPIILNADFSDILGTGSSHAKGWTIEGSMAANDNGAEFFNQAEWSISQDIYNLKPGFYRLLVNGFYRSGVPTNGAIVYEGNETEQHNAVLYAGEAKTWLKSIFSENLEDYGLSDLPCTNFEGESVNIPNGMGKAAEAFAYVNFDEETGAESTLYQNVLQFEVSEESAVKAFAMNAGAGAASVLKIGIAKSGEIKNDWSMFDNFRLEYLGTTEPSEDPTTAVESVSSASPIKAVTIYGVNGTQQSRLQKGVNIVKTVKADGSVKMVKVLVK